MQKLIIYLPNKDIANPLFACADEVVTEDLRVAAKDKEVIVVVPSEDVLLTQAILPKLSKSRIAQALPFALEEQLIPELETLHFASATKNNEEFAVAVIAKEKMGVWLAQLKEWGIKPDKVLPSCLTIPFAENSWHIVLQGDTCIARTGLYQGFACERMNLYELIQLAIATSDTAPEEIVIHNYTALPVANELRLAVATREEMLAPQNFISDLAHHDDYFTDLNLFQGEYSQKKGKGTPVKKMLYLSAAMISVLLIALFSYPVVSYFILKQRLDVLNTQVAQIYKRNFPLSSNMVAPKMRMEEKLHKLAGNATENRFLVLLSKLSYAMAETPNVSLKHFEYQNNQLNVEIIAGTSDDVTTFCNFLTNKGLNVKQQNAALNGTRVNATIVVE